MRPVNAGEYLFEILAQTDEVVYIGELGDFATGFGTQPDGVMGIFEMFYDGFEILFDFIVDFTWFVFHVIGHMVADAPGAGLVGTFCGI